VPPHDSRAAAPRSYDEDVSFRVGFAVDGLRTPGAVGATRAAVVGHVSYCGTPRSNGSQEWLNSRGVGRVERCRAAAAEERVYYLCIGSRDFTNKYILSLFDLTVVGVRKLG